MGLFNCKHCGVVENTALGHFHCANMVDEYDWTGIEDRKGKKLCSECAPTKFKDGTNTGRGKWHEKFPKSYEKVK